MRCGCFPYLIGKALITITSPASNNIILLKMWFNSIFNTKNAINPTQTKKRGSKEERSRGVGVVCGKGSELG